MTATSIDELRALELRRLRETFERVYERVPHYRHAFDLAGVRPGDLVSLDDRLKSALERCNIESAATSDASR